MVRPRPKKKGKPSAGMVTALAGAERETITGVSEPPESQDDDSVLLIVMTGNDVGLIHRIFRDKPLNIIGREEEADVQVLDAEISRRHAAVRYDAATDTYLVADLKSRNGTRLNTEPILQERPLAIGDKIGLGSTLLRVSRATEPEAKYAHQMYRVALRDGLTGAYNRRYLDERLLSEMAFAKRHLVPLTLLLLDLDHFKRVNDTYGHPAGDAVLQRFNALLEEQVRTEDMVARYGGEEFAVVCRGTDEGSAAVVAERLRWAVEKTEFVYEGEVIPVTVSIGLATSLDVNVDGPDSLLRQADQALYQAKQAGRNCWRVASQAKR
ncbi:MAG: GGDEF domain-containing protein [Deltaproteobacteria bacterium]|nr:GGDEF domain-containing protein [Deltaproteobacteria bacterium]